MQAANFGEEDVFEAWAYGGEIDVEGLVRVDVNQRLPGHHFV
jgi:hypothetical protein